MSKRILLLDFDGTLVNTLPEIAASLNDTRRHFGKQEQPLHVVEQQIGTGSADLIRQNFPELAQTDTQLAYFRKRYLDVHVNASLPYDGVSDTLRWLAAANVPMAVVTNKPRDMALKLIEYLQWAPYFAAVVAPEDAGVHKPDPHMIHFALEQIQGKAEDSIFVGDSEHDLEAAQNASVPMAFASWGFRALEDLAPHRPDFVLNHPVEMRSLCEDAVD